MNGQSIVLTLSKTQTVLPFSIYLTAGTWQFRFEPNNGGTYLWMEGYSNEHTKRHMPEGLTRLPCTKHVERGHTIIGKFKLVGSDKTIRVYVEKIGEGKLVGLR